MTKKEALKELQRCIISITGEIDINVRFHYGYEVDGNYFHYFLDELAKEAEKEERIINAKKLALNSMYGTFCGQGGLHLPNYVDGEPIKAYCIQDVESIKAYLRVSTNKYQVMFNNKTTILKYGNFKTVVKCDKRDRFVPIIGLGIALYRYYRSNKDTKGMIKSLETETKLSHLKLAEYSINYFCDFKKSKTNKLCELINNPEEGKWIELCL